MKSWYNHIFYEHDVEMQFEMVDDSNITQTSLVVISFDMRELWILVIFKESPFLQLYSTFCLLN